MAERCPTCAFRLDQGDGAFLGAMAINYGVAGTLFIGILIVWVAATAPDVPVLPLLLVGLGATGATILLFFPFSKTIWAAIDLLLHRMDRTDRALHDRGERSSDLRDGSPTAS
jgi:membrane protein implicated in regulation of membrane protease activity